MATAYETNCMACGLTICISGEDDDPVCQGCGGDFCSEQCRRAHEPGCTRRLADLAEAINVLRGNPVGPVRAGTREAERAEQRAEADIRAGRVRQVSSASEAMSLIRGARRLRQKKGD